MTPHSFDINDRELPIIGPLALAAVSLSLAILAVVLVMGF